MFYTIVIIIKKENNMRTSATYDSLKHLPLAKFKIRYASAPNNSDYNKYLENNFTLKQQLEIRQYAYAKELADKLTQPLNEYMPWTNFHKKEWTLGKVLEKEREQEQKKKTSFFSFSPSTSHKNDILETLEKIKENKTDNNTICEKIHKKYPEEISDALTRAVITTLALEKLQAENFEKTGVGIFNNTISHKLATETWSERNPYDERIQKLKEQAAQEAEEALQAFEKHNNPNLRESAGSPAPKHPSFFARLFASITSFFTRIYNYFAQSKPTEATEATSDRESLLDNTYNPLRRESFHETKPGKKPTVPTQKVASTLRVQNKKRL